jgi:hypothetical protein
MKTNIPFKPLSFISSSNTKFFQQRCREYQNSHLCSVTFFFFFCRLWDSVENYCRGGQATNKNKVHAHGIVDI